MENVVLYAESSATANDEEKDVGLCTQDSGGTEPDSPQRRELMRHVAANFPPLAFHAFGRLPDGVGDTEILALSKGIEELAFTSTSGIKEPALRKQAYYAAASKALLETVLEHCPPDADPTCMALPSPRLEPLSALRPHVARPPMDPRFNAISPFANHTGEPPSPQQLQPPMMLQEGGLPGHTSFPPSLSGGQVIARAGSLVLDSRQAAAASTGYVQARGRSTSLAHNGTDSVSDRSSRMQSIRRQMSLSLRQVQMRREATDNCHQGATGTCTDCDDSGMQPLSLGSLGRGSAVWGWLEAFDSSLPNVLLSGQGLAIGRSLEGLEARRHSISLAASESGALQDTSPTRRLAEVLVKALAFVEVSDGRVSRLHCILQPDMAPNLPFMSRVTGPATVEDHSANGTFLNGERLLRGERSPLKDGDRLSLVLSLSPMIEKGFIFRLGDPRQSPKTTECQWAETAPATQNISGEGSRDVNESANSKARGPQYSRRGLKRMATSRYTTADSSEPGDLMCQICLGPLRSCLALIPCGHNFCAHCLSHHFASLLQSGQPINCPLRCAAPERVVVNTTMRQLVGKQFPRKAKQPAGEKADSQRSPSMVRGAAMQERGPSIENLPWQTFDRARFERDKSVELKKLSSAATEETEVLETTELETDAETEGSESSYGGSDEGLAEMSSLCPLWDNMLPLDASSLKIKQVDLALRDLQQDDLEKTMTALEVLSRLAWSDDEVRTAIALSSGIDAVVGLMRKWVEEPGLLCNACLCLMSLVRGEGPACEANQWQVAKAGGVEAVVGCMTTFPANALVQLSALLCLIPLALDNPSLQAHVATLALPAVVSSLRQHLQHPDVQAKGLVVLGVLGQGEEAVHDAIRQQQLAVGVTGRILDALRRWGEENEEVLWAVLFSLAVLVRDGANPFQPAIRAVAAAGIPPLLVTALDTYKEAAGENVDEMIVTAGDYLMKTLGPASIQVMRERYGIAGLAMAPVVAASAFWAWRTANR